MRTVVALSVFLLAAPARAEPKSAPAESADEQTGEARELFVRGVELSRQGLWADALSTFERSAALHPHPVTTYNRGVCQRALGRYTQARVTFLTLDAADKDALPAVYATDARAFLAEIDRVLSRLTLEAEPASASLSVDGRPLMHTETPGVFAAGVAEPGAGVPLPGKRVEILLDPGVHVFSFQRPGYAPVVVNRELSPGVQSVWQLKLDRLPATLRVRSNVANAIVSVDGSDRGTAPLDLVRPAGTHLLRVEKPGFEPYSTQIRLSPGADTTIDARLSKEHVPITARWWFWGGAALAVAAAALTTYALTRPEPEPLPYDGGSTGWVLEP